MMTSRQYGYATLCAGRMVPKKHAAFAAFALLCLSATLPAQTINALTAQERALGWQLLFDGTTIAGWHVSAPAQAGTGAPQPPLPGLVGTPKACVGRG
jgi:hypothetical protein